MELQQKILKHFEGKVVRKDLTNLVKGNAVVPTYVLEYLLGQYCAIDDEVLIAKGIEKVKEVIADHYVHRSDAEFIKSKIREAGTYKIIDKLVVELNDKANRYEADFANLGLKNVPLSDRFVKANPKLLSGGGVWSIMSIGYNHSSDVDVRWEVYEFKPIQVSNVDVDEYIEARKDFTLDEWMDVLLFSIGLNPEFFTKRGKLIQISRLITHVENNFNFIELGPKGTGKSHVFSELSPHGVLVSGGDVSKARLFVNNNGDKIGLVGYWDVVALDEFEQEVGSKRTDGDLVKIMQNYMANQAFNRGKDTYQATASLAFVGNTKHTVPYMLRHSHLFESIPLGFIKGAFLDRMHLYSPGWEVKILKEAVFTDSYGFIVDYLAEVLRYFRRYDFTDRLDAYFEMDGSLTARDKLAIRKTFSGLMKILYPHQQINEQEAMELLDYAMEGRRRVKDQLYIIDETFRDQPTEFKFKIISSGATIEVHTLEKQNLEAEYERQLDGVDAVTYKKESSYIEKIDALEGVSQAPKQITIKDNQTGISYGRLFSEYIKGAKKIFLTDSYIRYYYQFKNLMEFAVIIAQTKQPDEEVSLHVTTWYSPDKQHESISNFMDLSANLQDLGIQLTWEFQEIHDRHIITDHGWQIQLGRGLDIFVAPDGRFDPGEVFQEKRKCKNCTITYLRNISGII